MGRFSCGSVAARLILSVAFASIAHTAGAQQPPEPVNITPNDGEIYYLINQHTGLQADASLPAHSNHVSQQPQLYKYGSALGVRPRYRKYLGDQERPQRLMPAFRSG